MNFLAIIPARSGSKGIPGKNLRPLEGQSLLAWSIAAAKKAKYGLRVVVSTDGDEIADEARRCGADVVRRPPEISGDAASSESALLHVLEELEKLENFQPDLVVFLQCTSPLTIAEDIDGCIEVLLANDADTALSVTSSHAFLWRATQHGAEGINHDTRIRLRRQDLEPEFRETGAMYVMKVPGFLAARHRFFGKTVFQVIPPERSWEIDDETDWQICETLARFRKRAEQRSVLPRLPEALVFDFDGVFTDNLVSVDQDGKESVTCNRSDGLGIAELRRKFPSIDLLILSKEKNVVVARRAEKLGIPVKHGIDAKAEVLGDWLSERGYAWENVVYVGNDTNDCECLRKAGCGVAVADAYSAALDAADLVLSKSGGKGAIRELIDLIIEGV